MEIAQPVLRRILKAKPGTAESVSRARQFRDERYRERTLNRALTRATNKSARPHLTEETQSTDHTGDAGSAPITIHARRVDPREFSRVWNNTVVPLAEHLSITEQERLRALLLSVLAGDTPMPQWRRVLQALALKHKSDGEHLQALYEAHLRKSNR